MLALVAQQGRLASSDKLMLSFPDRDTVGAWRHIAGHSVLYVLLDLRIHREHHTVLGGHLR